MVKKVKTEEIKKAEEKIGASALAVYSAGGSYVRTFSVEDHGVDFKKLAEGYAKKINGTVKKER